MAKQTAADIITGLFIDAIEGGLVDGKWERPWDMVGCFFPTNAQTGKAYRGLNALLLMMVGGGYFAGYKQWAKIGGQVQSRDKVGRGYTITIPLFKKVDDGKGGKDERLIGFKLGTVHSVDQQVGWESPTVKELEGRSFCRMEAAEQFIANCGANITHGSDRAFYRPSTDSIVLPLREQFNEPQHYYATALHELVHWTGHKSRLSRLEDKNRRGYAYEELVAELGASFLCAELGIHQGYREDHAQYIKGWLEQMRGDSKVIVDAARQAQQAVDHLKGLQAKAEGEAAAA